MDHPRQQHGHVQADGRRDAAVHGWRHLHAHGRRLVFRSGLYESPGKPVVRVAIKLPRFAGKGLYRTLNRPARGLGPARVLFSAGIGIHGWTTFSASTSLVEVTKAAGSTLRGRFHATLIGPKGMPFRAYDAWRCTTTRR